MRRSISSSASMSAPGPSADGRARADRLTPALPANDIVGDHEAIAAAAAAIEIRTPPLQTLPVVFSSPHSGRAYPAAFVAASNLDALTLRRSEDAFVDKLFDGVVAAGAPLLAATFPRAFVDVNREPYELDPSMFVDRLPDYANTASPRVAAGLGTIAKIVARGQYIYRDKLHYRDVARRIDRYYRPYHAALARLIAETKRSFGYCIVIDCHSMPSVAAVLEDSQSGQPSQPGQPVRPREVGVVLGDACGHACSPAVTDLVEKWFEAAGYGVRRNVPYAGGYITDRYGQPGTDVHCLQIELNRGLYLDEARIVLRPQARALARDLSDLARQIGTLTAAALTAGPTQALPARRVGSAKAPAAQWPYAEKRAAT